MRKYRRKDAPLFLEGAIVTVPSDPRRFAKFLISANGIPKLEFFNSVADSETEIADPNECLHLPLPPQTRAFVRDTEDNWSVGRIVFHEWQDDGSISYELRLPNNSETEASERDIFVRCLNVFADPSEILAAGCGETQFFADRRRPAMRRMRELRAAAQGLTGLVSSSIEIVPHQTTAARRVLNDTHQRYLLADEVGLGKTCEAGIIIRQMLLDDPARRVLILVPRALKEQWRLELLNRFRIQEFADAIEVLPFELAIDLPPDNSFDLLVIDEAHNVVASSATIDVQHLTAIRELARETSGLLLLSATPAFGNEDQLLELFNLLDPITHPLSDREGFRRKVSQRQEIGRVLLPLNPGRPPVLLRRQAEQARDMFPGDVVVAAEVEKIVKSGDDREKLDEAVESLRDYVIRTFRLHDRVVRTRRTDADLWFSSRGPDWPSLSHLRLEFAEEDAVGGIGALLEGWRLAAVSECAGKPERYVERYLELISSAWVGPAEVRRVVQNFDTLFSGETVHFRSIIDWAKERISAPNRFAPVIQAACAISKVIFANMGWSTQGRTY